MKILIIRLSSLGDIVHTYPLINDLKEHYPTCTIDWLVDSSFKDLVVVNPQVDNVIDIPFRQWKNNIINLIRNFITWKKTLANTQYDYIIDAQGLFKSALLTKCFSGKIYGFDKASAKEQLATYFYQHKIHTGKNWLAVQKNRTLGAKIFDYCIDYATVNFGLTPHQSQTQIKSYIIFFHATSKASKKYPPLNWANLAKYLITTYHVNIILPYGNAQEQVDAQNIKNLLTEFSESIIIPEKRYSYFELINLITDATSVFGVDTGLVHLSNALNKPTLAIFTDTNPQKTGVITTKVSYNVGNIGIIPPVDEVIKTYEMIKKELS